MKLKRLLRFSHSACWPESSYRAFSHGLGIWTID